MRRSDLKLRYLAVGCGHCGTGYVARLLTTAGVPCGHEHVFPPGSILHPTDRVDEEIPLGPSPWGIPWEQVQAESSWPALFHLKHPCVAPATIIHVVRNPLLVLRSWMHGAQKSKGLAFYIEQFLNRNWRIEDDCATHNGSYLVYPVESRLWLLDMLGLPLREGIEDDPTYNQHVKDDKPTITWDDIELACKGKKRLLDDFTEMSVRYGYGGPT